MRLRVVTLTALLLLTACTATEDLPPVRMLDGSPADLSEATLGVPSIVTFWSATCAYCKEELPLLNTVALDHPEISVIGVNLQDDDPVVAAYWTAGDFAFPTVLDPLSRVKSQFEVFTKPTTFFFDAEGNEIFRSNGPVSEEELEEWVSALLGSAGIQLEDAEEIEEVEEAEEAEVEEDQIRTSATTSILSNWYGREVTHSIPLEEILSGGPAKDGIPSIDSPKFLLSRQVDFLEEDDLGILVEMGNHVKFYPYKILNWHEIVNDEIDGEGIVVTYCPLCATGVVYSSLISEGFTEFGVSGMLYQSNLLMYDRITESLWNQVTGKAVTGPLTGEELFAVPSNVVSYRSAKNVSPDLLVLSTDTGFSRDYTKTPYKGYEESRDTIFPVRSAGDTSLHPKTLVYGIEIDGLTLAITDSFVREQVIFQGYIGEGITRIPLQIAWNPETEQIAVTRFIKGQSGMKQQVRTVPAYWFSWKAMYPNTQLMH